MKVNYLNNAENNCTTSCVLHIMSSQKGLMMLKPHGFSSLYFFFRLFLQYYVHNLNRPKIKEWNSIAKNTKRRTHTHRQHTQEKYNAKKTVFFLWIKPTLLLLPWMFINIFSSVHFSFAFRFFFFLFSLKRARSSITLI